MQTNEDQSAKKLELSVRIIEFIEHDNPHTLDGADKALPLLPADCDQTLLKCRETGV